jgi:NlpC/P60 family
MLRRCVVAGALATAVASTVALPFAAQAAPLLTVSVSARANVDPVAVQAASALVVLQRVDFSSDSSSFKFVDQTIDRIADDIALRLLVDPARLKLAWHNADREHQKALLAAFTQLGVPYRHNASKPGQAFDCSGLTTWAWGQAGIVLQRQSTAQIRAAAPRDEMTAQAGDLVQYPGHVMMWLGVDRAIIHAPYTGRNIEVDVVSARHKVRFGDPTG